MSPAGVPSTYTETPSGIYNVYRLLHAAEVRPTVYDLIIVSLKSNPGEKKNVLYIYMYIRYYYYILKPEKTVVPLWDLFKMVVTERIEMFNTMCIYIYVIASEHHTS